MKKLLAAIAAVTLTLSLSTPAEAKPYSVDRPCGANTLFVTHAASADWFDYNNDGVFCGSYERGYDNVKLNFDRTPWKFYRWDGNGFSPFVVRSKVNVFEGWFYTQEDDPDMYGCQSTCYEVLKYDDNDLLFVDNGNGSKRVNVKQFEKALRSADMTHVIYNTNGAGRSIFSVTT